MKSILLLLKQKCPKVNKYVLTLVVFAIFILFIGDSTLFHRLKNKKRISELEQEIAKYQEEKAAFELKLEMLQHNIDSLECFAREKHLMTKPGEELFIIK